MLKLTSFRAVKYCNNNRSAIVKHINIPKTNFTKHLNLFFLKLGLKVKEVREYCLWPKIEIFI